MKNEAVISDEYRRMQQELHKNPSYGVASLKFAPLVGKMIQGLHIASVADYGAGKQNLLRGLNEMNVSDFAYYPYDPAFPEYGEPHEAELVCCIDVLEHIEPELLENVLQDLGKITKKFGFFSVHTGPAIKVLTDGRNAHLIQEPSSWWLKRLTDYFEIQQLQTLSDGSGFWVLTRPKRR